MREPIEQITVDVDIDVHIEKLEKMKNLLIEIKSLVDDIFNKQECN